MKNIPVPSDSEYIKRLIEKTEVFIKRLCWSAFYFLNPETKPRRKETYGFRSTRSPPQVNQLKPFEDDLLKLIESVKFRPVNTTFQKKLNRDAKRIKNEKNILVPADKTNNYYTVTPQQYKKLMKDNVTAAYTRSDKHVMDKINQEAQTIANTLELADRIDVIAEKAAYITLKDHKDNFRNNPTCRLINPTKSEIGKIAKQTLDRINRELLKATNVNQWKNSDAVIKWFNTIKRKPNATFITFDVVNFYRSITEQLLLKALDFA